MLRSHLSHSPIAQQENTRLSDGELEHYIQRLDLL